MAVAYASSSTTAVASAATCVITKPSGLAAGDLMMAMVGGLLNTVGSYPAPTGWTVLDEASTGGESVRLYYKIADSGDAAATDFTFTPTGTDFVGGAIVRITGSANDLSIFTKEQSNTGTFANGDLTPNAANSLLLFWGFVTASATGLSTYACTTSNPSWTEAFDFGSTSPTPDLAFSMAYANRPEVTSTGDFTANNPGTCDAFFVSLSPQLNASVSPAVISVVTTVQAPVVSAGATVTPSVISVTTSVQAPAVSFPVSDWTNRTKNTSIWTNQTKH